MTTSDPINHEVHPGSGPPSADYAPVGLVRPEQLMGRAATRRLNPGQLLAGPAASRASRRVLLKLLGRMSSDALTIIDHDGHRYHLGPGAGSKGNENLAATISIADARAWTAVVREGSIGLGRGYIEGWWHTDDPSSVVRIIIRNLHGLDDIRNRVEHLTGRFSDAARRALPRSSRGRNREEIGAHYDLGNDFFELFLDDSMTYSSAVFADRDQDLQEASLAKYDRLLTKLAMTADHEMLEIGTGWGGMALRTAESYGASVTSTTVSKQQLQEAKTRLAGSEVSDRVKLMNRDWRDLEGRFDRIVSIEMIEAVDWRDYDRFFSTIERCLSPDGMVGIQAICVPDRRYNRAKNTEDFIRRFVFPGGFLPSIGAVARSLGRSTSLQILDVEDLSAHYAYTLRCWRDRFESRLSDIRSLGLDDRFCRLWRFYLAYCEAGFRERHCTVNQIVLVGPDWRPSGLELRPL